MKFPVEIITDCTAKTEEIGRIIAKEIIQGGLPRFVAMYGDLGVGKTAFVRGFCSRICPDATVKSPTFALVNEYKCSAAPCYLRRVFHFDMYRVADEDDLYSIGFYDYLRDDCICIAEWCEMIPYALPDEYIKVSIEKIDLENKRKLVLSLVK